MYLELKTFFELKGTVYWIDHKTDFTASKIPFLTILPPPQDSTFSKVISAGLYYIVTTHNLVPFAPDKKK